MPDVQAAYEHAKWLIDHGRGQEPAKLVLPRIEAQRRRVNKEQRTRVQFDCDPQTYADFHAQLSRYTEACKNHRPIALAIMIRLLAQLESSSIAKLAEDEQPVQETLGDA